MDRARACRAIVSLAAASCETHLLAPTTPSPAASAMAAVPAVPATEAKERPRGRLLQVLGISFGLAVIIGNTIGAGILRSPGSIAQLLPSSGAFLAVWIAGGIYALLGVASLAELGVVVPRSGGQYVFVREAFGPFAGFVIGWTDWVSSAASGAAVAIVLGEYSDALIPGLDGRASALAVAFVLGLALLQWQGIKWGDRTQQLTSLLKTIAFALLIAACFMLDPRPVAPDASAPAAAATPFSMAAIVLAMQAVIYTYDGWNGMLYFSGEVVDPGRQIPRAMFGGVIGVIAIYVLVNAALVRVIGVDGIAGSTFAAGTAANAVFGQNGDTVIRLIMIVSLVSSLNAIILLTSRVPYAMSHDGLFPSIAQQVNAGGTPTFTLAVSAALSIALIVTGTFETAIAIAAFFFVLNYVSSFASVFALRRKLPDAPRPYRAIGYPFTTAISFIGGVAFLIGAVIQDTRNSLVAIGLLAASYPVFRIGRK
jgi:basic amino acid/polyamine antiporter, APA family